MKKDSGKRLVSGKPQMSGGIPERPRKKKRRASWQQIVLIVVVVLLAIALAAFLLSHLVLKAADMKDENDLTI